MLRRMNELNEPHIVKFFTAFRRAFPQSANEFRQHCLILEWASGGNLRTLWKNHERPILTENLVKATVDQLQGLANAICRAHYPGTNDKVNYRHGDLKPENILWFRDDSSSLLGTLKIGDWGLAKEQKDVTELRSKCTTSPPGTRRYESPEEFTGEGVTFTTKGLVHLGTTSSDKRRSRLYDIWAMGCISLEFLLWLAYGPEELEKFNQSFNGPFYEVKDKRAVVKPAVVRVIQRMAVDPAFSVGTTALGDLLEIIKDHLLVVKLPQRLATVEDLAAFNSSPSKSIPKAPTPPTSSLESRAGHSSNLSPTPAITVTEAESERNAAKPDADTAKLPSDRQRLKTAGPERAHARRFQDLMMIISTTELDEHKDGDYWLPNNHPVSLSDPKANTDDLVERAPAATFNQLVGKSLNPDQNFMSFQFRTELVSQSSVPK